MTLVITAICFVALAGSARSSSPLVDSFATDIVKALESDVTGRSILEIARLPVNELTEGIHDGFLPFFEKEHIRGAKQLCDIATHTIETTFGNLTDRTFLNALAEAGGKTLNRKHVLNEENVHAIALQTANAVIKEAEETNILDAGGKWRAAIAGVNDVMASLGFETNQWIYEAFYFGVGSVKCHADNNCE